MTWLFIYLAIGAVWVGIAARCLEPIADAPAWQKIFGFAFVLFVWPVFWLMIAADGP